MNTYTVVYGEIIDSFTTEAIVIKNETLVKSPADGKTQLLVKSGERVRVGTPLFIVTTNERQKQHVQQEIDEIEEKIRILGDNSGSSSLTLNLINSSIENTTQKLKEATENGEFDRVSAIQDELTRLIKEKQKLMESNEANISLLKKQLNELKEEMNKIDIVVYATEAGIVSLNIDGLEDVLNPERAKDISFSQLLAVKGSENTANFPKEVRMNQPVLKIIDNFSWYIAFKPEKILEEGRDYNVKIGDDEKIKGRLTSINKHGICFLSIKGDLDRLIDSRKITVEVLRGSYSGCMIPKDALFNNNGKEGVYVLERGEKCFRTVELVIEDENYVIVNGLKQGDKILLNKRGLDELFKAKYTTDKGQN